MSSKITVDGKTIGVIKNWTALPSQPPREIQMLQEGIDWKQLQKDYELLGGVFKKTPAETLTEEMEKAVLQEIQHAYAMGRYRG